MISALIARLRATASAPPTAFHAVAAAALVGLGTWTLHRYINQQQDELVEAYEKLRTVQRNLNQAARTIDQPDDHKVMASPYPADEDLDPVGRGDQVPDTAATFDTEEDHRA